MEMVRRYIIITKRYSLLTGERSVGYLISDREQRPYKIISPIPLKGAIKTKDKISGIYCIRNIENDKRYIGQSIDIHDRWRRHISELTNGKHHNDHLQKSWNKYGGDSFQFDVLEECPEDQLDDRERFYIDVYNTMDGDFGYNEKTGGQAGNHYSEQTRLKMSESIKRTFLDPNRRKIQSENALKQWANPEIKQKILGENNGMYGKHHSEESKRKMGEAKKGRPSWRRNTTPVFCVELDQTYDCAVTAAKELSLDSCGILKTCRGERHTCGGYHWNFV